MTNLPLHLTFHLFSILPKHSTEPGPRRKKKTTTLDVLNWSLCSQLHTSSASMPQATGICMTPTSCPCHLACQNPAHLKTKKLIWSTLLVSFISINFKNKLLLKRNTYFSGQHSKRILPFCSCLLDAVQLLYFGYLASSSTMPETAFSIRLVQLHHLLWQRTALSAAGFVDGLMCFLDTRSHRFLIPHTRKNYNHNLNQPLRRTIDLLCQILTEEKRLQEALQSSAEDLWAGQCPCFF